MSWSARLLLGIVLLLAGAAAATWALARYQPAARFLGVVPANAPAPAQPQRLVAQPQAATAPAPPQLVQADQQRIAQLEARLARVENARARARKPRMTVGQTTAEGDDGRMRKPFESSNPQHGPGSR